MSKFDALIEAQLCGATIRVAPVVAFDFASGPFYLWDGAGPLVLGEGDAAVTYKGIAGMGALSSIQQGPGQAIEEMTLTLFGPDQITRDFRRSSAECAGRYVTVALQFFDVRDFDDAGRWVSWQTLSTPVHIFLGRMGPPMAEQPQVAPGSQITRTITVRAQNALINRRRPAFGFYSDRDQKARAPGDNIFIYASRFADKDVKWPVF